MSAVRTWTARPTVYRGVQMRSRLEARFAAILDSDGFEWTYEPRAYASQDGQYLPDFEVGNGLIEVKPTIELAILAMERMQIVRASDTKAVLVIACPFGMFIQKPTDDHWRWSKAAWPE